MPVLVLLNGPPASGKSTLAREWAAARPLALAVDIDVLRSMLGSWRDDPLAAGLAARRLAVAMIAAHLEAGRDVIVPQYLSQTGFIDELAAAAEAAGADFAEVVLPVDAALAEARFAARAAAQGADDVHGPFVGESMAEVVERHRRFVAGRGGAVTVSAVDAAGLATVGELDAAVEVARRR